MAKIDSKLEFLVRSISKVSQFVRTPLISLTKECQDNDFSEKIVEAKRNLDSANSSNGFNSENLLQEEENEPVEVKEPPIKEDISIPIVLDEEAKSSQCTDECKTDYCQNGDSCNVPSNSRELLEKKRVTVINDYLDLPGAGKLLTEVTEKPEGQPHKKEIPEVIVKDERNARHLPRRMYDNIREAEYSSEIYIRGDGLKIYNDNAHAIRDHIIKIRQISYFTMAKLVCSMLNTVEHGVIYFGINYNGTIRGLTINREQRDSFRCGVDNIMTAQITPRLLPYNYKIRFVSVFRMQDVELQDLPPDNDFFVVEVYTYPSPYTLYKLINGNCYLRKNGETVQATFCDVQLWIAGQEEKRYLSSIQVLSKAHKTIKALRSARNSADYVEDSSVV